MATSMEGGGKPGRAGGHACDGMVQVRTVLVLRAVF